jgi:hypothetical protein
MEKKKPNWDAIPSIVSLKVDWDYEPENPLGKRAWARIANKDLLLLFNVKSIPVKVVSKNYDKTGMLLDVSKKGLAVLLHDLLENKQMVKIGLFLGKEKVITRAIVRNINNVDDKYRVGLEFVDLEERLEEYIIGLSASKNLQST